MKVVLPEPFGPKQAEHLAAPDVERQPVKCRDRAVAFADADSRNGGNIRRSGRRLILRRRVD